ncbi:hypothetical protein MUK60_42730 [Streptomyces sp. LRE541]|uniref:hypothetical protein n=1 Tax=Streptomyces sp. LRE541 TaxID=2931983 RepID=UPI00200E2E2E|nr:hypothetical protein [Streptomyces sp. LRE541]UPZ26359.1 hypothetical protein MUK60_00075 [Streptomyces sp. LRE541]UPZ33921.1 hypothetical protein MUK60_42730 [Streptomyces sp. LRE541]
MSTPEPVQPVPAARPEAAASSGPASRCGFVSAPGSEPFVSLHTAVVLLAAAVIGLVIAALTILFGVRPATAAVTGLTAAGASVTVLRTLIR